jgi:hypothetical protein
LAACAVPLSDEVFEGIFTHTYIEELMKSVGSNDI